MIEEPRRPLTDVNLNAIRDVLNRHRVSYQWSAQERAAYFGGFTPPTPQEIDDSITALLMEVAQRRQQEAAMREIMQAVAHGSWYTHSSMLGGTLQQSACCPFSECEMEAFPGPGETTADERLIPHTPDCPVTKARTILAEEQK